MMILIKNVVFMLNETFRCLIQCKHLVQFLASIDVGTHRFLFNVIPSMFTARAIISCLLLKDNYTEESNVLIVFIMF